MDFCILSPLSGLERYSTLSRTHLLLPQVQIPRYRSFYVEMRRRGDFLILDNGAWEGNKDWYLLLKAIELYEPDVVVLPDFLLQSWEKTYHEASTFLDNYHEQFPKVRWGFCPQAVKGDVMGFLEGLIRMLSDGRVRWYFLPRALATDISQDPLMRVRVCEWLKKRGKRVHALGMLDGSTAELAFLRDARCDSIDSNAPVFRGLDGLRLGQRRAIDTKYRYETDEPITPEQDRLILQNLEDCGIDIRKLCDRTGDVVQRQASAPGEVG